ncbi:MAG TPA: CDP-alcohol phosphatidyltransferase family protein [Vicinamibacterales bacterium]|nr:CDP-alcohol phosphatidyltransferase family protein [Vicinamibacterales bacterium]
MPPTFGIANSVTTVRAVLTLLVALAIAKSPAPSAAWFAVGAAVAATALDGVDGWAARRFGQASAFGARFDMEVDAALIMTLSVLAWKWDKAGAWVLLSGLLRYLFVAAGWIRPWMSRPLEPRRRRQTVCVIQIVALIVVVSPIAAPPLSTALAAAALAILGWSFAIDTSWLLHRRQQVA